MKYLCILIALMSCNAHSMSTYELLNPKTTSEKFSATLKELRYGISQSPIIFGSYASILVAASVITWNMHPMACVGLHYFSTLPTVVFSTPILSDQARSRKEHHKTLTFFSVEKEKFDEVTTFAAQTCYQETDQQALQEQNTEFLFHALDTYNGLHEMKTQKQRADNYTKAAKIFLTHHADKAKIMDILTNHLYRPAAKAWLECQP